MSGRSCSVSPIAGSMTWGFTNTTRPPRSRMSRNARTGSGMLRNDDLLTRGFEPITTSRLGPLEIGNGVRLRDAVEQLRGRVLVGAVLAGRREHPVGPERAQELHRADPGHRVERVRIAEVHPDRPRTVAVDELTELVGDGPGRVAPRHVGEGVADAPLRAAEPGRVAMDLGREQPVAAREPAGHRVVVVRPQLEQGSVGVGVCDQATAHLAEPAVRPGRRHSGHGRTLGERSTGLNRPGQ